jgi:hypothetical protein
VTMASGDFVLAKGAAAEGAAGLPIVPPADLRSPEVHPVRASAKATSTGVRPRTLLRRWEVPARCVLTWARPTDHLAPGSTTTGWLPYETENPTVHLGGHRQRSPAFGAMTCVGFGFGT